MRASSPFSSLLLLLLAAGCNDSPHTLATRAALDAPAVGVVDGLTKIRPDFAVPPSATASIEAARNEFEPFQIAVAGGASGVKGLTAVASELVGPAGARIPAADVRFFQEGLYHVNYASNVEGAAGDWPDPLIPDVDAYFGEKRNGLPFDVAAATTRAIWVEVFVPRGLAAGLYAGDVTVSAASGLPTATVHVALRVRDFELPSTASLKSAFGFSVDNACRAHHGETYCTGDADAAPLVAVYGRAALEHRISFFDPYYTFPSNGDFTTFDANTGPLLDGTAAVRLPGAHMTTTALGNKDSAGDQAAATHFAAKGWKDLFDYTCDEPPATCAFSDIPARAAPVHAAGLPTLVTTDLAKVNANGLADAVDIIVPVIDSLQPAGAADNRASYDAFLARSPMKQVWTYQSCDEHGCASGCTAAQASATTSGWPTYMIDSSPIQNRAMQWLDYELRVSGELYFETAMHLDDAWNSHVSGHNALCDFGGNGDGALFYPGTPAQIGGTHDVPVESLRLALIREGMEDYEYLHLLDTLGGGDDARAAAKALFPAAWQVTKATPAALYATRAHLADLIEARLGTGAAPTVIAHADGPVDVHGDGGEFAAVAPIVVAAGAGTARFRMLWDESALYVAADVDDKVLSAIGSGHDGELWNADSVELMIDPMRARAATPGPDVRHVIVSATGDLLEADGAGSGENRAVTMGTSYAVRDDGTVNGGTPAVGYRVIMAVPWSGIGVVPAVGSVLGLDLALDDLDGTSLTSNDWAAITPFAQPIRWNAVQLGAPGGGAPGDGAPGDGTGGNAESGGASGGAGAGGALHAGCSVSIGARDAGGASSGAGAGALVVALLALAWLRERRRAKSVTMTGCA